MVRINVPRVRQPRPHLKTPGKEYSIWKTRNPHPDGFKAGEIVGERVAAAVDRQVDTMMKNGVRDALQAAVDGHVRQMTDGPARDRLETICSGRNCAVYLSTETVVATFRASLHYALD